MYLLSRDLNVERTSRPSGRTHKYDTAICNITEDGDDRKDDRKDQ